MPTVKIELKKGWERTTLLSLRDEVMNVVVDVLKLSQDDRNIRVLEYDVELFQMKPPYEILIEICLFAGRSKETKRKLYREIVQSLDEKKIVSKENVFIILHEIPMENWGVRGGVPADEIKLDFEVKI